MADDLENQIHKASETPESIPQSSAQPVTASELVAADKSVFPPTSQNPGATGGPVGNQDSVAIPPANATPVVPKTMAHKKKGWSTEDRQAYEKDRRERIKAGTWEYRDRQRRKPVIRVRDERGRITDNVVAPPGYVPPETPPPAAPDFSDLPPNAANGESGGPAIDGGATLEPDPVNYQALGAITFDTSVGVLTMVFGPEWQPENSVERQQVVDSLARYFQVKGVSDIPPGVMLTIVCLTYSASRFRQPATSTKLRLTWTWFRTKWKKWRDKRKGIIPTIVKDPIDEAFVKSEERADQN